MEEKLRVRIHRLELRRDYQRLVKGENKIEKMGFNNCYEFVKPHLLSGEHGAKCLTNDHKRN